MIRQATDAGNVTPAAARAVWTAKQKARMRVMPKGTVSQAVRSFGAEVMEAC